MSSPHPERMKAGAGTRQEYAGRLWSLEGTGPWEKTAKQGVREGPGLTGWALRIQPRSTHGDRENEFFVSGMPRRGPASGWILMNVWKEGRMDRWMNRWTDSVCQSVYKLWSPVAMLTTHRPETLQVKTWAGLHCLRLLLSLPVEVTQWYSRPR